jgi:hypothetical protein
MTYPAQVAAARHARARRIRAEQTRIGVASPLPDPDTDLTGYLAALRQYMRGHLAHLAYAEAWIANRKAHHLSVNDGDRWRAHHDETGDQDLDYWKSQRTKAHERAHTMALAILAEQATREL